MSDSNDGYTRMIQKLFSDYVRAPWDWDEVTPGPSDFWYDTPGGRFMRSRINGVIIAVPPWIPPAPSEGEPMPMNPAISGTVPGISPTTAPLLDGTYYKSEVQLGETYREEDTGFEGVAQAIYFYRNSCERVELERYSKKRGLEQIVFDAKRLSLVNADGTTEKLADAKAPGGPDRGNPRRSTPNR